MQLYRERANTLSRPIFESSCIECCCNGTRCKDENDCCYKCFVRNDQEENLEENLLNEEDDY